MNLIDELKDYYLYKCSKNEPYHRVYIMQHKDEDHKKIVEITLYDLDEVIIKKGEPKHKYIVKITDNPSKTEIAKYSKYSRKYIPIIEDEYLYNNYFRKIDQVKHDNNGYIDNYRTTLNKIYGLYKDTPHDNIYFNLFEKVQKDSNYKYDDNVEIDDWLKLIKDKKLSLCHNYFENKGKLYHLFILPDVSRGYYDNTDTPVIEPDTSIFEMTVTNDGRNLMKERFSMNYAINTDDRSTDMETMTRFINRQYFLQPNKGIQIKYSLFILGAKKEDDIINLRDIKKEDNELLKHAYHLSSLFIYNLYGFTIESLNITTRNPTDAYGLLYFKITNYTPSNYYVIREGVYEKENELFTIIQNNEIPNYYANKTFEYSIEYYQYLENYKKYLDGYELDTNKNESFVSMLKIILGKLTELPHDRSLAKCYREDITSTYKKTYKLCDKEILNDEIKVDDYLKKIDTPQKKIQKDKQSLRIKYKSKYNTSIFDDIKNMNVIRFFDDAYKNYAFISKDKYTNNYKLFKLNPTFMCDNYINIISQIKLKKIVSNHQLNTKMKKEDNHQLNRKVKNWTMYYGYVDVDSMYSDVYRIVKCDLPNITYPYQLTFDKCGVINDIDRDIIKQINAFYLSDRFRVNFNSNITEQLHYHFNYLAENKIETSYISTVPPFIQLLYLGVEENMLMFNYVDHKNQILKNGLEQHTYIFNNGKFIIRPDRQWTSKLKEKLETYDISDTTLPQIHYTVWYNPYDNNVTLKDNKYNFSLWENALVINNKKTINPATFKKIMDTIEKMNAEDIQYNIFRNVYNAYKKGYFENKTLGIENMILEYYNNEKLESIFRHTNEQFFLNLINPQIINQKLWNDNIKIFIQNNSLLANQTKTISYIHKAVDPETMILHIHLVFELLNYNTDVNISEYVKRFASENTSDVLYNLSLDPNYYKGNHTLLSKLNYSHLYVNITDHNDPILFDYPLYPTFNLKIVELNERKIIYPNEKALDNKLGFGYDQFNDKINGKTKKDIYIEYVNKYHINIDDTRPFTFQDWLLNRNIRDIYQSLEVLKDKFKNMENKFDMDKFIEKLWQTPTIGIREFYKEVIFHYSKINNMK